MPPSPPDHRICAPGTAERLARMTVAQMSKARLAPKASSANLKAKPQMHRRSRTGCYTCRLRRKKCDEGTPRCTACKHLGLECEYRRPAWWSNNDSRKRHKEDIKNIIKRKKLAEKSSCGMSASVSPPPGLSRSLPTSTTTTTTSSSDATPGRMRSASVDSHHPSAAFNFNSPPRAVLPAYSPYEVDVKTERQMFVNDVPTLHESHVATFSTYQTPPPPGTVLSDAHFKNAGAWTEHLDHDNHVPHHHHHRSQHHSHGHHGQAQGHERRPSAPQETLDVNFFDFAHGPHNTSRQVHIELEDGDQRLLDHFVHHVLPIIFPILESNQHGSVGPDLILPALQSNSVYLHCCLSIAAQHLKTHANLSPADIDGDIMKHRYATILSLCESLKRDENYQQILEAALALTFFQCIVGRLADGLPDVAWHQHFQAAISVVQKLDLPRLVSNPAGQVGPTPFNMTLTAWIDILGATMRGTSPTFAHTYRDKHLSLANSHLGLRELMGCEDRVMYLISEIACLDSLKTDGMDDYSLCQHVAALGEQLTLTEVGDVGPRMPYSNSGTLSPKQLCRNITSAFRIAARIYLCSLIPGFSPSQSSPQGLVEKLTLVLHFIPSGPHGYDRSLVWVYLVAASATLPGSGFRAFFGERIAELGDAARHGAFGRMTTVVREVWKQSDRLAQVATPGSNVADNMHPYVNWRDIMRCNEWDFLLI